MPRGLAQFVAPPPSATTRRAGDHAVDRDLDTAWPAPASAGRRARAAHAARSGADAAPGSPRRAPPNRARALPRRTLPLDRARAERRGPRIAISSPTPSPSCAVAPPRGRGWPRPRRRWTSSATGRGPHARCSPARPDRPARAAACRGRDRVPTRPRPARARRPPTTGVTLLAQPGGRPHGARAAAPRRGRSRGLRRVGARPPACRCSPGWRPHNLGYVEFLAGDLPRALHLMHDATELDGPRRRHRAARRGREVLVEAGLLREADDALALAAAGSSARDRLAQDLARDGARAGRCALALGDVRGTHAGSRPRPRGASVVAAAIAWQRAAELVLPAGRPGRSAARARGSPTPARRVAGGVRWRPVCAAGARGRRSSRVEAHLLAGEPGRRARAAGRARPGPPERPDHRPPARHYVARRGSTRPRAAARRTPRRIARARSTSSRATRPASAASICGRRRRCTAGGSPSSTSRWRCGRGRPARCSPPPNGPGRCRAGCRPSVRPTTRSPRSCSPSCGRPSRRCARSSRTAARRRRCCARGVSWSARSSPAAGRVAGSGGPPSGRLRRRPRSGRCSPTADARW